MKKEIFIAFVGFWNSFDINDNFLINPLKKKFKISVIDVEKHPELKNKVQYLFYGDFSKSYLTYSCVRIYYTGENLFPNFNSCDYAIGYDYISLDDRYIRYPFSLSLIPMTFGAESVSPSVRLTINASCSLIYAIMSSSIP